jgi:NAD(P)-dependent dehydrogenase (short-subunit alcohol dehydrogenase family)
MRKILLTGGTGLIGQSLLRSMIEEGHYVAFTTRSKSKGEEMIVQSAFPRHLVNAIEADFFEDESIDKILKALPEKFDTVIHNARSLDTLHIDARGMITTENFQNELFMAVTFPYHLTMELLDKHSLKDILFIGSMYGVIAPTPPLYDNFKMQSPVNYGVAKAAQIHLTKELAVRLADQRIRVNCISFGGVEGRVNESFKKRYQTLSPMGRMLNNGDLYPVIQMILNNPELAINGENIKVDGGWSIW